MMCSPELPAELGLMLLLCAVVPKGGEPMQRGHRGRAGVVLACVSSSGQTWWKMFQVGFCLNLSRIYGGEREKEPQNP